MIVLAIDPGTEESAVVQWESNRSIIHRAEILPNQQVLDALQGQFPSVDLLAIEMVASYGMPVGREVFETVWWIGRFCQAYQGRCERVYRLDVKRHHCHDTRAKDANIRQALIDKYGPPGTKKAPGITYPLKSHLWAAFAIATFVTEREAARKDS